MVAYVFTPHARFEMARRGLPEVVVREVLSTPGQRIEIRPGRRTSRIAKYWRESAV
jgi:hypothetical protein